MTDAACRGHPLHVTATNLTAGACGVAVLKLSLVGNGYRLESAMRMGANAAPLISRRKLLRRGVVEQQEGTELTAKAVVIKHGANGESVSNPMHS